MKKQEEITILYIEPNKEAKTIQIKNELETFQKLVGGWIECLNIEDDVVIICNEEGKINGLPLNRAIHDSKGNIIEIMAGSFIIAGDDFESGEFTSLSLENIDKYYKKFQFPEFFIMENNEIKSIKIPFEL